MIYNIVLVVCFLSEIKRGMIGQAQPLADNQITGSDGTIGIPPDSGEIMA